MEQSRKAKVRSGTFIVKQLLFQAVDVCGSHFNMAGEDMATLPHVSCTPQELSQLLTTPALELQWKQKELKVASVFLCSPGSLPVDAFIIAVGDATTQL